ncbi:hypothetical protein SK803_29690 [Lentzea sp. BCCO 10_0856]|uniref:Extracellular repeat, HAF family n=1 Tax=Lentzea miocenica TaxID=3095431 RepID=A0ABU4T8B7_9PSEU|nr:hypothetical protein [Lentzea sp. BCCO 10_0856]MDX8034410.1 hypothetical protein [Lentzea sp. BCCO 10_0856]
MVLTGGWRVFTGALLLSAGVVAPATASADPGVCGSWDFVELPVPPAVQSAGVVSGAGSFAVGNGSFSHIDGTTVLVWKGGQLVDQLSFSRNTVWARDVNSSGVVVLSAYTFPAASRWQAGVYESLQGLPGEHRVEALDVNERGDVLGLSAGKPVVWPAGSGVPQQVPGTDASWKPVGIADDGSVLATSASGAHWIRSSGVVSLGDVQVRAVRGNYAVGAADSKVVRWDVSGNVSGAFSFAAEALAVNSHGHVLGRANWGGTELWEDPDRSVPVPGSASFVSVTDEGDLYGSLSGSPATPLLLDCAGGVR